jgi:hypothetical protein
LTVEHDGRTYHDVRIVSMSETLVPSIEHAVSVGFTLDVQ